MVMYVLIFLAGVIFCALFASTKNYVSKHIKSFQFGILIEQHSESNNDKESIIRSLEQQIKLLEKKVNSSLKD